MRCSSRSFVGGLKAGSMAKKKAASRKPGGKAGKNASAKRPTRSSRGSKPKKGPRSQSLPGMEQVRNARLDNVCEDIAEERRKMNAAKIEEQASIQAALQIMQGAGVQVYKHDGI